MADGLQLGAAGWSGESSCGRCWFGTLLGASIRYRTSSAIRTTQRAIAVAIISSWAWSPMEKVGTTIIMRISDCAAHGHRWWELDVTYLTIRLLESVGLATQVVRYPLDRAVRQQETPAEESVTTSEEHAPWTMTAAAGHLVPDYNSQLAFCHRKQRGRDTRPSCGLRSCWVGR